MPITPQNLLPRRALPEVATGPVISVGTGTATVRIRPGLSITVPATQPLAVGQMVTIAMPGGNLSAAQVVGNAAGTAAVVRQVVV